MGIVSDEVIGLTMHRAALPAALKLIVKASYSGSGQALIETPLTCGGMGECSVCAVSLRQSYTLAGKDGPVFDLRTLLY